MGFEPTVSSATNWRFNQLSYIHHITNLYLARQKGLEPPAHCLEGSCSIQLSYWRIRGASDGNRTHTTSLEGWSSTTELHSHISGEFNYSTVQWQLSRPNIKNSTFLILGLISFILNMLTQFHSSHPP